MSKTLAIAGNPNTGKSTLFNALTGSHQHTGNWPGKTVERKEGEFTHDGQVVKVVDLPGTYSLTAVSSEEIVTRDFIVEANPDAVIVIADATNLERNLYLVLQVLELTDRVVVALNMMDQVESKGVKIDLEALSRQLGVPVVPITALKKEGIPQLVETAMRVCKGELALHPASVTYDESIEQHIAQLEPMVGDSGYPARWLAIKLLEGDADVQEMMQSGGNSAVVAAADVLIQQSQEKPEISIAGQRYEFISRITQRAIRHEQEGAKYLTDRIDDIVTHKLLGVPILMLIAGFTLWAIYAIAGPIGGLFEGLFNAIMSWAGGLLAGTPWWVRGVIVDGILLGFQQIFVYMFGVLVVFFFIYGVLEDVGYLARGAFLMDRVMKWLGLPGKAFMTIFAGFGCSIPGVMGTRIIDDENDRIITSVVVPFIPCAARIAVITAIVPIFFGSGLVTTLVTSSIFGLSLLIVALVATMLKKTTFKNEPSALVMEMPDYHPPLLSNVLRTTWDRTYSSISKALMIFLPFSVLMWVLFNLPAGTAAVPWGIQMGHSLDPIGRVIGLAGRDMTGFLFTYPAKELSLLYLGLSYGGVGEEQVAGFMGDVWTPLQAFSYLVFLTLYAPCLATVAAMAKEIDWKWTSWNIIVSLAAGFGFAGVIYWGGTLLGLG